MSDYDCVHGYDISKYKCPKCESGMLLADSEIKKQQALIHNPLFVNKQQGEVKQGFFVGLTRVILRKAQEL